MNAKERINKAYEHLRYIGVVESQKDLAEMLNANYVSISRALKGNEKYLTQTLLDRFCNAYGDVLNAKWLLTGEGEMLKQSADTTPQSETISMPADVWKVISNQAESLKTRDKQIDSMLDTLNVKEKQTAELIALLQSQLKKSQVAENQSHVASQVVEEEE